MKIKSFRIQQELIYILFIIIISFYSSFNQPGGYFCCFDTNNIKNINDLPLIRRINTTHDDDVITIFLIHSSIYETDTFLNYSVKIPPGRILEENFKLEITLKLTHIIRFIQHIVLCSLLFGFLAHTLKLSTFWSFIVTTLLVLHPILYPETIYNHISITNLIGLLSFWVSLNLYMKAKRDASLFYIIMFEVTLSIALKNLSFTLLLYPLLFIWDIYTIIIKRRESLLSFIIRVIYLLIFTYMMIIMNQNISIYYDTVDLDKIVLNNPLYSLKDRFQNDKKIFMSKVESIQNKIERNQFNEMKLDEIIILSLIPLVALSVIVFIIKVIIRIVKPRKKSEVKEKKKKKRN